MEGNVLKVYGTFIALRKPLHFFVSRLIRDFGGAVRSPRAAVLFCALASPGAGAVVVVVRQPLDGGGGGKPTAATRRWNWRRNFYLIPT